MHSTVVVGKRLYIFGGDLTSSEQQVWGKNSFSAEILDSGRLGEWRPERRLPEYRAYIGNSTEVINNHIYLIGGNSSDDPGASESQLTNCKDALWTTVQSDGSLAEWQRSEPFPTATGFANASTCSSDRFIFVLGGRASDTKQQVLVTEAAPDGKLSKWRIAGNLPIPLWFHGSALLEDRIYVWGGLSGNDRSSINARVFSAQISITGAVGTWTEEARMSQPIFSSAYCGFNDYLIAIGGRYADGTPTNSIWFTQLVNGRVTQWQGLRTDLDTRLYHSLGLDKSHGIVYVTGGQRRLTIESNKIPNLLAGVQNFRLSQPQASRLDVANTPAAASPNTANSNTMRRGLEPLSLDEAFQRASAGGKEVLAFFYSPEVPACRRFWDSIIATDAFASLLESYVFAAVDISRGDQSYCYTYGVFKVPALIVLGRDKQVRQKTMRPTSLEDVKTLLETKK